MSTTEHVAVFVWDGLKAQLANPEILYEVKIHETEKNIIRFRGEYTNWLSLLIPLKLEGLSKEYEMQLVKKKEIYLIQQFKKFISSTH